MAILTSFPSVNWKITFNEDNENLMANRLQITGNSVLSLSSSGVTRDAVLQTATDNLVITSTGVSGVSVISVQNADLLPYLDEVRWLLNVSLTENDISNRQIERPYLRSAEYEVYDALGVTETQYDTRAATDTVYKDKTRNAVLYRAAALLVPAVPDILEEQVLRERYRFVQYDPDKKIEHYLRSADKEIEDYVPVGSQATGFASGSYTKRYTGF